MGWGGPHTCILLPGAGGVAITTPWFAVVLSWVPLEWGWDGGWMCVWGGGGCGGLENDLPRLARRYAPEPLAEVCTPFVYARF